MAAIACYGSCFFQFSHTVFGASWAKNQRFKNESVTDWTTIKNLTHLAAFSALPPPSLAPVWAVELTPPLRQRWPDSADPGPRRSPQTHLHQSSWTGVLERNHLVIVRAKYILWCVLDLILEWFNELTLTTFHLSLTTSVTDRMSVCSAAPLILSVLSCSLHLASVAPH